MEFRILGPLEVWKDTEQVTIAGTRQQTVLSTLLLYANRTVTVDRLMDAVYGDDRPATARVQVQISTSRLRRMFVERGLHDVIATQPHGYTIKVARADLDFHRFEDLVGEARQARDAGRPQDAVDVYQAALSLWRGDALTGIDSPILRLAAGRLAECQIMATEDCLQIELELGRHHQLVGRLTELLALHPLRERLREQLMTALYRCGRDAEALQVYQEGRRVLIDDLGIEPPRRLQQLEYAILTADHSLDPSPPDLPPPVRVAVPDMLPSDVGDFTGRALLVSDARSRLTADQSGGRLAVPIVVVTGRPGVGKTALALRVAHRAAEHFDGGRLYADLHGSTDDPVDPADVLERFLRVLEAPGSDVPKSLEERAELFRARLAGRRVLIVLDDIAGEKDVWPLLPGNAECGVLVTSRSRLAALPGAYRLPLDILSDESAVELLSRVIGDDRVREDEPAAVRLAQLCGGLPLALRIAGTRLSARPHWSVGQLVDRLTDDTRRLTELSHGGLSIRAALMSAYRKAGPTPRMLFRRLAVLESPTFCAWGAWAVLDLAPDQAQEALDALTDIHLLEATATPCGPLGQYRMPDLVRVFARERLDAEESEAARAAMLVRVLEALLVLAEAANSRAYGIVVPETGGDLPADLVNQLVACPRSWFEQELPTLMAGVAHAARAGRTKLSWRLAVSVAAFFRTWPEGAHYRDMHAVALTAAEAAGDRRGQAMLALSAGTLHLMAERFGPAHTDLTRALELFVELGDERGWSWALGSLGRLDQLRGRLRQTEEAGLAALDTARRNTDPAGAAYLLHSLAQLQIELGHPDAAMGLLVEARDLARQADCWMAQGAIACLLGQTHLIGGRIEAAQEELALALTFAQSLGDPSLLSQVLRDSGIVHLRLGRRAEAEECIRQALRIAESGGLRLLRALALQSLGRVALSDPDPAAAIGHLRQACDLLHELDLPLYEARALALLTQAHVAAGDTLTACETLTRATALEERVDRPPAPLAGSAPS